MLRNIYYYHIYIYIYIYILLAGNRGPGAKEFGYGNDYNNDMAGICVKTFISGSIADVTTILTLILIHC